MSEENEGITASQFITDNDLGLNNPAFEYYCGMESDGEVALDDEGNKTIKEFVEQTCESIEEDIEDETIKKSDKIEELHCEVGTVVGNVDTHKECTELEKDSTDDQEFHCDNYFSKNEKICGINQTNVSKTIHVAEIDKEIKETNVVKRKEYSNSHNSTKDYKTIANLVETLHGRPRRNAAISVADLSSFKIVIEEKERKKKKYNVILDTGCAWMVLFASFLTHVIVDGAASSFGVFYVLFLELFGESRGLTSWIGSLQISLMYLMGNHFIYLDLFYLRRNGL